jgi:hypothetical protein
MLLGAALARLLAPPVGNLFDPWFRAAPFVYAIVGSLIGLSVDIYLRTNDEPTKRELILAAVVCGLLAIACAVILH